MALKMFPLRPSLWGLKPFLAKRIVLLAWGINKSEIIQKAVEGLNSSIPTTYLQEHHNTTLVLDHQGASGLTRIKTPWITGNVIGVTFPINAKRFIGCAKNRQIHFKTNRGRLQSKRNVGAFDLRVTIMTSTSKCSIVCKILSRVGQEENPMPMTVIVLSVPCPKRTIIFSPHPDDDVISMGGTFDRLVAQGHEVHVAYQTSGNIAVSDDEALKYIEVVLTSKVYSFHEDMKKELLHKQKNTIDSLALRKLKAAIRKESLWQPRVISESRSSPLPKPPFL